MAKTVEITNSEQRLVDKLSQMGAPSGKICFYLPNPPQLTPRMSAALLLKQEAVSNHVQQLTNHVKTSLSIEPNEIDALIDLNGNHWRKIFVIMAKICAPNEQWRNYMPSILLENEKLYFNATELDPDASFHIICGAQACLSLGFEKPEAKEINVLAQQSLKNRKGVVIITPYLDYRQYPNVLIEQTRQVIYSTPPAQL